MAENRAFALRQKFSLKTLLILVLFVALALGWIMDHRRIRRQLRQSELQNRIYERQVAELQKRLAQRFFGFGSNQMYWWATADEFIEALKTSSDEEKVLRLAPSLAQADADVHQDAVRQLIELLNDPNEQTQKRSVITLRFLQELAPERMVQHAEAVVTGLIPLLDDSSRTVIGETIFALQSFGPAARPALDALHIKMWDDGDWYAPVATLAISKIDPSTDIGPRLTELVKRKHPNWYHAAFHLPRHVPANVARQVLTELYDGMNTEGERNAVIQAMNQINP